MKLSKRLQIFCVDDSDGSPLAGVLLEVVGIHDDMKQTFPLGVVASDHVGFAALDITVDSAWSGIKVSGALNGKHNRELKLGEFTDSPTKSVPIVMPMPRDMANGGHPLAGRGLRALEDWDLSPRSFTAALPVKIGEDGCQSVSPNTFAERQISFFRIVRHSTTNQGTLARVAARLRTTQDTSFVDILEFRQSWVPLGHATGDIVYSFPLAPCESVKIAVLEATRTDQLVRSDNINAYESLQHDLTRDRTLSDVVSGILSENRSGFGVQGGASYFGLVSLGGSYNSTQGRRDLAAESLSDLRDATRQASSLVREAAATVITQASQTQNQRITTRTITNHNHCHTLTIQFFELVRNYRVKTELARVRVGVRIPFRPMALIASEPTPGTEPKVEDSDLRILDRWRPVLENNLISDRLTSAFDAAGRLLRTGKPVIITPADPGDPDELLQVGWFRLKRGQYGLDNPFQVLSVQVYDKGGNALTLGDGSDRLYYRVAELGGNDAAGTSSRWCPEVAVILRTPIRRSQLESLRVRWDGGNKTLSVRGAYLAFQSPSGPNRTELINAEDSNPGAYGADFTDWATARTATFLLPPLRPPRPQVIEQPNAEQLSADRAATSELITHLAQFSDYYTLLIARSGYVDLNSIAASAFANIPLRVYLGHEPLGYVAGNLIFPIVNGDMRLPRVSVRTEVDFVSLPSRGLLGEAQLGNCTACEARDVTRFWDWQESPCPDEAPEITGIQPQQLGPPPGTTPMALPTNVVQIANPPGDAVSSLAGAVGALGALGGFGDMSGQQNTASLLRQLAAQSRSTKASDEQRERARGVVDSAKAAESADKSLKAIGVPEAQRKQIAADIVKTALYSGDSPAPSVLTTSGGTTQSLGAGSGPRRILSGPEAAVEALRRIQESSAITVSAGGQWVELTPGSVWTAEGRVLVSADTTWTWFTLDSDLYVQGTSEFVREHLLGSYALGGARAGWVVTMAKTEAALLSGLFIDWQVLVSISLASVYLRMRAAQVSMADALGAGTKTWRALSWLWTNHPDVVKKLGRLAGEEIAKDLAKGIRPDDIAFWVGRLARGFYAAGANAAIVTLASVAVRVTTIVAATHAPGIAGHALQAAVDREWGELQKALGEVGVKVTEAEARKLLTDLLQDDALRTNLDDLAEGLKELLPIIEAVSKSLPYHI